MNSRRLMVMALRSAVFLAVALAVFFTMGRSWFAFLAVGLIAAATLVQLGGALWLRRTERSQPDHGTRHVPELGSEL